MGSYSTFKPLRRCACFRHVVVQYAKGNGAALVLDNLQQFFLA